MSAIEFVNSVDTRMHCEGKDTQYIYYTKFFTSGGASYNDINGGTYSVYIAPEDIEGLASQWTDINLTNKHIPQDTILKREDNFVYGTVIKSFYNKNGFIKHDGQQIEPDNWIWGVIEIYPEKMEAFTKDVEKYKAERFKEAQIDKSHILDGLCDISCSYRSTKSIENFKHAGNVYNEKVMAWTPHHIALVSKGRYNGAVITNEENQSINLINKPMTDNNQSTIERLNNELETHSKTGSFIENLRSKLGFQNSDTIDKEDKINADEKKEEDKEDKINADDEMAKKICNSDHFKSAINNAVSNALSEYEKEKENKENGKSYANSDNSHFQKTASSEDFQNSDTVDVHLINKSTNL